MNTLPPHTEDKVENGRVVERSPSVSSSKATVDMADMDSKHQLRRVARGGTKPRRQRVKEYSVALGSTLLAFLLRLSLDSYLGDSLAYAAFLVAVAITTWYGGIGPSLTAVVLGGLIANWMFIHARYMLSFTDLTDQAEIAVYLTISFAIVGFAQTWQWSWRKTDEMAEELQYEMNKHRQTERQIEAGPTLVGSTGSTPASPREHRL